MAKPAKRGRKASVPTETQNFNITHSQTFSHSKEREDLETLRLHVLTDREKVNLERDRLSLDREKLAFEREREELEQTRLYRQRSGEREKTKSPLPG